MYKIGNLLQRNTRKWLNQRWSHCLDKPTFINDVIKRFVSVHVHKYQRQHRSAATVRRRHEVDHFVPAQVAIAATTTIDGLAWQLERRLYVWFCSHGPQAQAPQSLPHSPVQPVHSGYCCLEQEVNWKSCWSLAETEVREHLTVLQANKL